MKELFHRGQEVEVKTVHVGRNLWRKAKVRAAAGKGADVRFVPDDGRTHFFCNCDIRVIPPNRELVPPNRRLSSPLLSASDVEKLNNLGDPISKSIIVALAPAPSVPVPVQKPLVMKSQVASKATKQPLPTPTSLSFYLRTARQAKGWSQQALAEKLKTTNQYVSAWETGRFIPDDDKLIAYAEVLSIDLDTALEFRANPKQEIFATTVTGRSEQPMAALEVAPPEPKVEPPARLVKVNRKLEPVNKSQDVMGYLEFCKRLATVSPVPTGKQDEWNLLAAKLWSL